MAVDLATVTKRVNAMLNAGSQSSTYNATVTDVRWHTTEIVDAVLAADAMVVGAEIFNINSIYAAGYYITTSNVTHGAIITAAQGPIISVKFTISGGDNPGVRQAFLWDVNEINQELFYPNLKYDCHFNTDGRVIYHNGAAIAAYETATVSVDVVTLSFTKTSACQASDTLEWLVFVGAMAQLVAVEGENVGAQSYWGQLFMQGLSLLRQGQQVMPVGLEEYAREQLAKAA